MVSSNPVGWSTNKLKKFDGRYEEEYYVDHYLKSQVKIKDRMLVQKLKKKNWNSSMAEFFSKEFFNSAKTLYQLSSSSDQVKDTSTMFQQKQDFEIASTTITNQFQPNESYYFGNYIEGCKTEIEELELELENTMYDNQQQSHANITRDLSDDCFIQVKPLPLNNGQSRKKCSLDSIFSTFKTSIANKTMETSTLSCPDFPQTTQTISHIKERRLFSLEQERNFFSDEEENEEMIIYLNGRTPSKIRHKIRFNNNIVRYLRGPLKSMVHGTMYAVDICAQGTRISDAALQAVKKGLDRQKEIMVQKPANSNSMLPTFVEITSDWTIEGENPNRGFSSPSIWMRDPQGRRILAKIQEHPLCAANEWLAYALGRALGLPVNEVQIAVHKDNLVTLHTDVACEGEKTVTFMNLPKQMRKILMNDLIMATMDIFDRIIENVDRNQQNILITIPKTVNTNDKNIRLSVHFIDHSNCFGMGKLNGISLIASKFHSNHLAVVKFDPIQKARQFEQYLTKLPVEDYALISETLHRFAMVTDEQLDSCMSEIQDLLSSNQYDRIRDVLYRERDITEHYIAQWETSSICSSMKSDEIRQDPSTMDCITIRL